MASVSEYLKKLLYQYDCVVVPELGAFLTHYQPASFQEATGQYLPPRKRVAFNEALRLDDGILSNYIMLHEPLTREGAQRHISLFVSGLRQQVQHTGSFDIDGLGLFSQNDEGKLQFEPSLRHNFFGDAYGMSAVAVQPTNRALQTEPVHEAVPVTAVGPVLVRDEDTQLVPLRRSRPVWRVAAASLLVGSLGAISYFSVIKPGQPLQSSLDPANLLRVPAAVSERFTDLTKPTTTHADVAKSVVVSPVVKRPAITPAPVQKTEVLAANTPGTTAPKPVDVAKPTTVAAPLVKPAPAAVVAAPAKVLKRTRTTPFYTVIAGGFASRQNAVRLKHQLRKAGYTDAYIIFPTSKKQLYKVAAFGSETREEAVNSMATIGELVGSTPWVLRN